jgi:HEAT repeat protein
MLEDPGPDQLQAREAAAEALGELRDPRAVDPLIAALLDEQNTGTEVQSAAARALGGLEDPRAISALEVVMADRDERRFEFTTQQDALFALAKLGARQALRKVAAEYPDDYFREMATDLIQDLPDSRGRRR